jgi:hypothetical protein
MDLRIEPTPRQLSVEGATRLTPIRRKQADIGYVCALLNMSMGEEDREADVI